MVNTDKITLKEDIQESTEFLIEEVQSPAATIQMSGGGGMDS